MVHLNENVTYSKKRDTARFYDNFTAEEEGCDDTGTSFLCVPNNPTVLKAVETLRRYLQNYYVTSNIIIF